MWVLGVKCRSSARTGFFPGPAVSDFKPLYKVTIIKVSGIGHTKETNSPGENHSAKK